MVFRRHKKKTIFAVTLTGMAILFFMLLPMALKPIFEIGIRKNGFPKAHIENVKYLSDGIYIDKILLDANGFTEIDDLEIRGKWADLLLHQRAERITIKKLNISGEIDAKNRITIAGWDGTFGAGGGDKAPLPFTSLYLESLTADFDTSFGAIRVQGKINLGKDNQNNQVITADLFSSQQQLTTTLEIKSTMDQAGNLSGRIDISDSSVNIAPVDISRASGWVEFKGKSAAGQLVAGGIKYNDMPFEDANLVFDTTLNPVATFKTKMTGQNVSLSADLINKPQNRLNVTATAQNLGELAALADVENAILAKSGPVNIKASVKLTDNFAPANEISVAEIKTSMAGGILGVKPFIYYGDGRENSLQIELMKIKLSQLLDEDSPLEASGSVSGNLPLTYKGSEIQIHNGIIRGDQPASFKYTPKEMPAALQGDDPRMDTVRKALSNYNYDSLEMKLDGPLNGNLKTTFTAKGKSPAFENRPVNLNLNLEGALASALTQALKPGTLDHTLQDTIEKESR